MNSKPTSHSETPPGSLQDFSLVLGGPLFQFLIRWRLTDDTLALLHRRIIVITTVCWLPLLVLSALEGRLIGSTAAVPFLLDIDVHIRFLVAVPLLICAELVVHRRLRPLVRQFLERNLVADSDKPRFDAAVASAFRLRNSVLAEVLLLAFVYGFGILVIWRHYIALDTATWFAVSSAEGSRLSLAGLWYGYVSQAIFQFLLCRWLFRLIVWGRFLWQVSRIDLRLVPTHPDRAGGLGFLSQSVGAFTPLAVAIGSLLAGLLANRIFHMGAALPQFRGEIGIVLAFVFLAFLSPLLVFGAQLGRAKRKGLTEYDALAQRYAREFDDKWLRGGAPVGEPLVGSSDLQSLADLGNSLDVVRNMRFVPIMKRGALTLAAVTLAPCLPLLLTMMPLDELLKTLFGILF